MSRSRVRGFLFALATLFVVTSALPAQAQSSDKLKLSYVAPDECIFFLTWNGWTESDPKTTNRTEKLFAEPSVKDFGNQLMEEVSKLINTAAARGGEEASVAAQLGPTLAKVALAHPGAIYLTSIAHRELIHGTNKEPPGAVSV